MSSFGFASFRNLIKTVDKDELFDAIKPELQDFADHKFGHRKKNDAYIEIFVLAHRTRGEESNPPSGNIERNVVERMGKGRSGKGEKYGADQVHAEWLYFFFLFSDECEDPVYAERIDDKLFGESFHDKFMEKMRQHGVPRPRYLPALQTVPLGPITISLGHDSGLTQLSLQEPQDAELNIDGEIGVFRALDWRSRLTTLHGRQAEHDRIVSWALDHSSQRIKVMLISGPGGSGKTRLAADAVDHLVRHRHWEGGFLTKVISPGVVFDGGDKGVALIIDSPEERIPLVEEILKAAFESRACDRPVRIILVSRESHEAWEDMLNEPFLDQMDEVTLGTSPYLPKEDALNIIEDVTDDYPTRIGKAKSLFSGAEEWLDLHHSHRLPLITLAASVHAVLEPEKAFTLSGKDVLTTLAKIELKIVRRFSERDLGDRNALEKLLALSLLTSTGLSKETICALGGLEICSGKSGAELLEAIQKTPFWEKKSEQTPSHITRLQPDKFAAAFLNQALTLDDPLPGIAKWIAPAAAQEAGGFGDRFGRLALDLGYFSGSASRSIETLSIQVLDVCPELAIEFGPIVDRKSSDFTNEFCIELCTRILSLPVENGYFPHRISNNLATFLLRAGRHDEALTAIRNAISLCSYLEKTSPEELQCDLASSHNNESSILSVMGFPHDALNSVDEAIAIWCGLTTVQHKKNIPDLAAALNNKSDLLSKLGKGEQALSAIKEALSYRRNLARGNPSIYRPDLATSLNNKAAILFSLVRYEKALIAVEEAIEIRKELAISRPDLYLQKLARSLSNYSGMLSSVKRYKDAHCAAERAIDIYQTLEASRPQMFQSDLAASYYNSAFIYDDQEKFEEAKMNCTKAIETLSPPFLANPKSHFHAMQTVIGLYANICQKLLVDPDVELVRPIAEVFGATHREQQILES